MVRKRFLSDEEKQLWKLATQDDVPLRLQQDAGDEKDEWDEKEKEKNIISRKITPVFQPPQAYGALKQGVYVDIDRNTAERFRRGDTAFDATLDLHGMTRANAHRALVAFLQQHYGRGSRTLLVITGKGSGILRDALPDWLVAPELRGYILAFDVAKQKHGGTGAYYILLKRKRTSYGV